MQAPATAPSYKIRFEHRPEYLYAYVESDVISYDIAKQFWTEITGMLHRRKYQRLLVDKNIRQALSIPDAFTLVSELAHSDCVAVKLAIADHYYDPEKCKFEEMVGANRGLRITIVKDVDEAEKWLLDN